MSMSSTATVSSVTVSSDVIARNLEFPDVSVLAERVTRATEKNILDLEALAKLRRFAVTKTHRMFAALQAMAWAVKKIGDEECLYSTELRKEMTDYIVDRAERSFEVMGFNDEDAVSARKVFLNKVYHEGNSTEVVRTAFDMALNMRPNLSNGLKLRVSDVERIFKIAAGNEVGVHGEIMRDKLNRRLQGRLIVMLTSIVIAVRDAKEGMYTQEEKLSLYTEAKRLYCHAQYQVRTLSDTTRITTWENEWYYGLLPHLKVVGKQATPKAPKVVASQSNSLENLSAEEIVQRKIEEQKRLEEAKLARSERKEREHAANAKVVFTKTISKKEREAQQKAKKDAEKAAKKAGKNKGGKKG